MVSVFQCFTFYLYTAYINSNTTSSIKKYKIFSSDARRAEFCTPVLHGKNALLNEARYSQTILFTKIRQR